MRTYKYKLYNSDKNKYLGEQIDIAASVWNHTVALQRKYYKLFGKYASVSKIQKHYTKLKKAEKYRYWEGLGSQAIQEVVQRVDRSYQAFFDYKQKKTNLRKSPPKFKKRDRYSSFTLKQAGYKLDQVNGIIEINKRKYRYFKSRDIVGTIKTLTVKRTPLGEYFVTFVCSESESYPNPRTGNAVGMDFGLKHFLTLSDGSTIDSPQWFRSSISEIRKANQSLSKCQLGSNHRKAAGRQLERVHKAIANRRRDWFFKLADKLTKEYAAVCIEDLNIKAMQRLWGRKISDYAFSEFVSILEWEALKNGCTIVKVDRWLPSSKACHVCGMINENLTLKDRSWTCNCCSTELERDQNAAVNILRAGLAMMAA